MNQINNLNCVGCEGEQLAACNAAMANFRTQIKETTSKVTEDSEAEDEQSFGIDIVGIMEAQQTIQGFASESAVALRGLGCTLSEAEMTVKLQSNAHAEATLLVFETLEKLEELAAEEEAEEAARIERIENLLAQSKEVVDDARQAMINIWCEGQGVDKDNLTYVDKMQLSVHLKSIGFKGLFEA